MNNLVTDGIKIQVEIDTQTTLYLGAAIFLAVMLGIVVGNAVFK